MNLDWKAQHRPGRDLGATSATIAEARTHGRIESRKWQEVPGGKEVLRGFALLTGLTSHLRRYTGVNFALGLRVSPKAAGGRDRSL